MFVNRGSMEYLKPSLKSLVKMLSYYYTVRLVRLMKKLLLLKRSILIMNHCFMLTQEHVLFTHYLRQD